MLTCAHTAWKSTSAPLFFCTFGKETVDNLKISRGQLAPCQEKQIKRQQTVSFAGCKVLASNAACLLALISSFCHFRPIACFYSESLSVSVPQDKIRGSAIYASRWLSGRHHDGHDAVMSTSCGESLLKPSCSCAKQSGARICIFTIPDSHRSQANLCFCCCANFSQCQSDY